MLTCLRVGLPVLCGAAGQGWSADILLPCLRFRQEQCSVVKQRSGWCRSVGFEHLVLLAAPQLLDGRHDGQTEQSGPAEGGAACEQGVHRRAPTEALEEAGARRDE